MDALVQDKVEITSDEKTFALVMKRAVLKGVVITPTSLFGFLGQVHAEANSDTWPQVCYAAIQVFLR